MPTDTVLVFTQGAAAGTRIPVGDELVLTRTGLLAEDERMSRRHARIFRNAQGELIIEDLGSTNGTYVGEVRIAEPTALRGGELIRVGGTTLELQLAEAEPEPEPQPEPEPEPTDSQTGTADPARPIEQIGSPSSVRPLGQLVGAAPPLATLVAKGRRWPVPLQGISIGRQDDNDLVLDVERASRHHARILPAEGRFFVADLDSSNGTYLNGERLVNESRWLNAGDRIEIGGEALRFVTGQETYVGDLIVEEGPKRLRFDGARLAIGRDPANDLHFDSPNVSRFHAEIVAVDGRIELRDLGSRNGTRLDGEPVTQGEVVVGSEIGIGPFRLIFDGSSFTERDDRGALRLEAYDVSVQARDRLILDRSSLTVQPGEFVALIGESGAGKTTLIRVLAGVRRPTSGLVSVNGEPIWNRLPDVGYLPQDEIVHPRLTVVESLRYSARLRLPLDSSDADVQAAVERVLSEMSLVEQANTRIGSLSGGQRKRVGLATELLSRPGLLFLDEPTTGLDPGLEARMMELFRELAAVGRSAVLVATHATRSLELVDKLCVVGRGGHLCFVGPPAEARSFFRVSSFDDIYGALEDRPAAEWRRDFESMDTASLRRPPEPPVVAVAAPRKIVGDKDRLRSQTKVLLARYAKVFARDQRNLLILLLQAPLLGFVMALLFKSSVFDPAAVSPNSASQLLFVLVTTVIWLGTIDSAREVIKERAVFSRERAVGVDPLSYLASKAVLLSVLAFTQTVLLVFVVLSLRSLHESSGTAFLLLIELLLTAFAAVAMGLLISTAVRTEDQATAVIPIAMIVQLLFGGAIVTVKNMGSAMGAFAGLVFERWSFAGAGNIIDMNGRIDLDQTKAARNNFGTSFFSLPGVAALAILLVFLVAMLAGTLALLRRQDRA